MLLRSSVLFILYFISETGSNYVSCYEICLVYKDLIQNRVECSLFHGCTPEATDKHDKWLNCRNPWHRFAGPKLLVSRTCPVPGSTDESLSLNRFSGVISSMRLPPPACAILFTYESTTWMSPAILQHTCMMHSYTQLVSCQQRRLYYFVSVGSRILLSVYG